MNVQGKTPVRIAAKLQRVSARIMSMERQHMSAKDLIRNMEGKWATICPDSIDKRISVYHSTPPDQLYEHLSGFTKATGIDISGMKAADLGSGLAASSVVLSYFCRSVTGFELFAPFIKDARAIAREFGYRNIRFRNKDFVEADLSKFNFWYVYWPFMMDFSETMVQKIAGANPETIIILRNSLRHEMLGIPKAEIIYPLDYPPRMNGEFVVMRKL